MKAIWKFETPIIDRFTIKMPIDAEILCVQVDEKTSKPCIWAMVETDNGYEHRYFELFGTGHELHTDMGIDRKYLGTYQCQKGEFVGHLFERTN
jgi:hypothetical protein